MREKSQCDYADGRPLAGTGSNRPIPEVGCQGLVSVDFSSITQLPKKEPQGEAYALGFV